MFTQESMLNAACEIRNKVGNATDGQVTDTGVTNDGAWHISGYSSYNEFVATISPETGKVLDSEPMSRICKSCGLY